MQVAATVPPPGNDGVGTSTCCSGSAPAENRSGGKGVSSAMLLRETVIAGGKVKGSNGTGASSRTRHERGVSRETMTAWQPFNRSHGMSCSVTMLPTLKESERDGGGVGLRRRRGFSEGAVVGSATSGIGMG
jgi:hypothetical protein